MAWLARLWEDEGCLAGLWEEWVMAYTVKQAIIGARRAKVKKTFKIIKKIKKITKLKNHF